MFCAIFNNISRKKVKYIPIFYFVLTFLKLSIALNILLCWDALFLNISLHWSSVILCGIKHKPQGHYGTLYQWLPKISLKFSHILGSFWIKSNLFVFFQEGTQWTWADRAPASIFRGTVYTVYIYIYEYISGKKIHAVHCKNRFSAHSKKDTGTVKKESMECKQNEVHCKKKIQCNVEIRSSTL